MGKVCSRPRIVFLFRTGRKDKGKQYKWNDTVH
jgi:hypothetical protein